MLTLFHIDAPSENYEPWCTRAIGWDWAIGIFASQTPSPFMSFLLKYALPDFHLFRYVLVSVVFYLWRDFYRGRGYFRVYQEYNQ
jgi:hypothetical protein